MFISNQNILKLFTAYIICAVVVSCNSGTNNSLSASEIKKDSNNEFEYDSINPASVKADEYFEGPNLDTVLKETKDRYTKREKIDTTLMIEGDTFSIRLEHYCLLDSAIRLGKPYTSAYEIDSFITHNFASSLTIMKNRKSLIDIQITKKDFEDGVDSTLLKFGSLFSPHFRYSGKFFVLNYSLSIPLTDVGRAVKCRISLKGDIQFITE